MRRRNLFIAATLGALLWILAAIGLDRWGLIAPPSGQWDAIIVAGCRVQPDGSPSIALAHRVERAVALWQDGAAPRMIFTGGIGDFPPAEAQVAARYAESLGVSSNAILIEDRSTSTEGNAREAARLDPTVRRVLVVTDSYHVLRAQWVFGRYFAEAVGAGSVGRMDERARGALREVLAVGYYAVRGRL